VLKVEDCSSALEVRSIMSHNSPLLTNKNLVCSEIAFGPHSKVKKPKRNREIEKWLLFVVSSLQNT